MTFFVIVTAIGLGIPSADAAPLTALLTAGGLDHGWVSARIQNGYNMCCIGDPVSFALFANASHYPVDLNIAIDDHGSCNACDYDAEWTSPYQSRVIVESPSSPPIDISSSGTSATGAMQLVVCLNSCGGNGTLADTTSGAVDVRMWVSGASANWGASIYGDFYTTIQTHASGPTTFLLTDASFQNDTAVNAQVAGIGAFLNSGNAASLMAANGFTGICTASGSTHGAGTPGLSYATPTSAARFCGNPGVISGNGAGEYQFTTSYFPDAGRQPGIEITGADINGSIYG
ncbi:MAG: hypothetical protein ACYDDF_08930 [Thermoplasmatota archaeon]